MISADASTDLLVLLQKGSLPPPDRIGAYIKRMEKEGVARVKMFLVITVAYLIFWGPLFLVTLFNWSWEWVDAKKSMAHEVEINFKMQVLAPVTHSPKLVSNQEFYNRTLELSR